MLECPVLPVAAEREVGDVAPVEFLPGVHGLAAAPAAVDAVAEQLECALAGGLVVAAVGACPGCAGLAGGGDPGADERPLREPVRAAGDPGTAQALGAAARARAGA